LLRLTTFDDQARARALEAMQGEWLERLVAGLRTAAIYVHGERIWLNAAAENLTGYRSEELPTLDSWFDTFYAERSRELRALHDEGRRRGYPKLMADDEIRTRDGRSLALEYSAYQYGDHEVFFVFDVTARTNANRALKESESRLRGIVETAADAILTFDGDGRIVSTNPAAERMFAYSATQLRGRRVTSLVARPERSERRAWNAPARRLPAEPSRGVQNDALARRRDGTTFPVEFVVSDVGSPDLFTVIVRDISERHRYETLVAEVATAEQARIGRDLHDIVGQNLAAVALSAERASREVSCLPGSEKLAELAEAVRGALADVRAAARGLMSVADDAESLLLALQELTVVVEVRFGIECRLQTTAQDRIPAEVANHLYRIASEAVNNAVHHAEAGRIDLCLTSGDAELLMRVTDDGIGFSGEGEGKGIGTSIMRNRAAAIGAEFRIESPADGGTVVTCRVPRRKHGKANQGRT
jgi:PAS domain S-box-containing protein